MSWSCSTTSHDPKDYGAVSVDQAINKIQAMTATQPGAPDDAVAKQLSVAKEAAVLMLNGLSPDVSKVRVNCSGHVHTGQDAPDAINVSLSAAQ